MQVGDLVRIVGMFGTGIVTEIEPDHNQRNHSVRVLFAGTGYEKLDGYHWCNPTTLEVINENR